MTDFFDKISLAARILCCPDCRAPLDRALACSKCNRVLAPGTDGIVGALPREMERGPTSKDELQHTIGAAPDEHRDDVVLYERAFHDEQASYYDKVFADPLPLGIYYKNLIRRHVSSYVREHNVVVDLCCGTGKSSIPLAEQGLFVVGIDVSREMLRAYRDKWRGANLLLVHADASRPPLRSGSCGAISMIGGLHHVPSQADCVALCCDALSEGGVFIVHEPLKTGQTSKIARAVENLYAVTDPRRVWTALKKRIGLGSAAVPRQKEGEPLDFTPYERPFSAPQELLGLLPDGMETLALRSMGVLSFRDFAPYLQGAAGVRLAPLVVRIDDWLSASGRSGWYGDAMFGVFRKTVTRAGSRQASFRTAS